MHETCDRWSEPRTNAGTSHDVRKRCVKGDINTAEVGQHVVCAFGYQEKVWGKKRK
jgi:hypothetical protein